MKSTHRAGLISILIIGGLFPLQAFAGVKEISCEDGLLENIQVIFLACSTLFFLLGMPRAGRGFRCVLLGAALLCSSFIFRELDVEDLSVPQWVIAIGSGAGRNLILGALWLFFSVVAGKSFRALIGVIRPILFSRSGLFLIASVVLLLAGLIFDQQPDKTETDQFVEEVLETIAFGLLFLAALGWCTVVRVPEGEERGSAKREPSS